MLEAANAGFSVWLIYLFLRFCLDLMCLLLHIVMIFFLMVTANVSFSCVMFLVDVVISCWGLC